MSKNITPSILPTPVEALKPIADTDELYGTVLDYLLPSYSGEVVGGSKTFSIHDVLGHLAFEGYNTDSESSVKLLDLLEVWGEYIPADMTETRRLKGSWEAYGEPDNARGGHFAYVYDRQSVNDYVGRMWSKHSVQVDAASTKPKAAVILPVAVPKKPASILTKNDMIVLDALHTLLPAEGWSVQETVEALTERLLRSKKTGSTPGEADRAREVISKSIQNLITEKLLDTKRRHKGPRLLTIGRQKKQPAITRTPQRELDTSEDREVPFDIPLAAQIVDAILEPKNRQYYSYRPSKLVDAADEAAKASANATARQLVNLGILLRHGTGNASLRVTAGNRKELRRMIESAGSTLAYLTIQAAKHSK